MENKDQAEDEEDISISVLGVGLNDLEAPKHLRSLRARLYGRRTLQYLAHRGEQVSRNGVLH